MSDKPLQTTPQLAEIARAAGVAISTALRVLSGRSNVSAETTEKVLSAHRELTSGLSSSYAISKSRQKQVIPASKGMAKQADVARLAKVGSATVSRALSGGGDVSKEKMSRILSAVHQLGYLPNRTAQTLRGKSSGLVGVVLPSFSQPYAECVKSIEDSASFRGFLLVICVSNNDERKVNLFYRKLCLHRAEGMIILHSPLRYPGLMKELSNTTMSIVGVGSNEENRGRSLPKGSRPISFDYIYIMEAGVPSNRSLEAIRQNAGQQAAELLWVQIEQSKNLGYINKPSR